MTRTFLVAVSFDDGIPPDPIADALEIEEALESAGIPVESVKMWLAPTLQATQPLPPIQ
jgi:hypothetical protein